MHIQIKKASTRKRKDDKLLDTHPCIIVVTGEHNHAACAKALKELRVLPEVEKEFFEYFHRGMGAAEAQRYHRLKLDLGSEFWMEHARADTNPTLRAVQYMREKWAKATVGGYNDEDMFDALKRYMEGLIERRAEWAIAYRQGSALRGNHTNNYAEATMCIIKDIVMNRCKARNACELIMLMDEIYNGYMVQRLIDFALGRRQSKRLAPPTMNEASITRVDDHHFRVASESDPNVTYDVAMDVGVCSCPQGQSGAICKHQLACSHVTNMTLPQAFKPSAENRRWLMCVAVGEDKAPDVSFFGELTDAPISEKVATEPILPKPSEGDSGHPGGTEDASCAIWDDDDFEAAVPGPSSSANASETVDVSPSELRRDSSVGQKPSTEVIDGYWSTMRRALLKYGDGQTNSALIRATGTVAALKTSNQLNSYLQSAGPRSECLSRGGAGRGKIRVQPTSISRRPEGQPRGAARLGKGRRPKDCGGATAPAKRRRCLAGNVSANVPNAKGHGAGH
ncbi:hypothetical protein FJT64_006855 [Amphibalanus amphitrite]|uniref:SWIM-type domain-containing protein n=1 Tax=Amphibalanus amphitrite TaxID=1232801 RepID=A0A6A4VM50_AMPAM|nr:hypothetical protein FJT64_006855 [Amphibalanus amphitrite]